ncbi:MAG TPA: hypothetical protein VKR43_20975 [Bryobacteraceae bacterium]|nr:hypothetical protein [Bryobacteraceae bacterium]
MSMMQLTEVEPGTSARPAFWTWSSPEAPIRIALDLPMVSRLRSELEQSSARSEAGGVLLGCVNQAAGNLEIHGYVLLPPQEESAGDYSLDIAQLDRLRRQHANLRVVGYFRTQSEGALHLRRPESNLISTRFSEPSDVVLLIRTAPRQDFKAGFLFWDHDTFVPFSVLDFPFDAAALANQETEPQPMSFSPMVEAQIPEFRPSLETSFAAAPAAIVRDRRKPQKPRPNWLALGALAAGVVGLGIFLLRSDLPEVSKPAEVAVSPVAKVAPPATPEPPPAAKPAAAVVPAPRPKASASSAQTPSAQTPSTQAKIPAPAPKPKPVVTTQTAASAPPPARTSATQTAIPLAPPPDLTAREQPPVISTTTPTTTAPAPAAVPPPATTSASVTPGPAASAPASGSAAPVAAAPTPREEVVARKTPDPAPKPPQGPSRFAGGWSYPLTNGLYHGSQPEVVEIAIQETNGRLSGTAYARLRSSTNEPVRTLRFQFTGDVRPGRTQAFSLETVDGTKGTVELIPGTSPNLLEINFRTTPEGGNGQSGNMILVKK